MRVVQLYTVYVCAFACSHSCGCDARLTFMLSMMLTEVTVQFEMASYERLESEGIFMVKITASGQASFPYSLALTTMDIEAKQPSDYNLSSTVTFQAGEESVLLPIAIINDDMFEPNETFKVIMTLPDDVTIPGIRVGKNNVILVRILNDDPGECGCACTYVYSTYVCVSYTVLYLCSHRCLCVCCYNIVEIVVVLVCTA